MSVASHSPSGQRPQPPGRAVAQARGPAVPQAAAPAAPHAPEAGWLRRLLGPFHVTGVFWYRLHGMGAKYSPARLLALFVAVFSTFFFFTLFKIRRAVADNLVPVLGPCGWWRRQARIYRTFWTFAWCLTERYERWRTERPFTVRAEGEALWWKLNERPEGFILVSAHLGNWEVGSMLPIIREARRVHVIREAEADPRAQQYIADLVGRLSGNLYVTHFAEDPQLGVQLLDALRRGEIAALQGDRPRAGGRTIDLSLFGKPFPLPVGPAALARAAGVPLVPVFIFREGRRRYCVVIRPPIDVPATADRQGDLAAALQRFAGDLQWAIAHRPHQWFCFRQLWEQ